MPSSRTTIATSLLCLVAISLSGCSLRYDNPPDALPQLNSGQSGISRATRAEEAISTAATSLSSDGSVSAGVQQVASYIADTSASQLSAMGGVWNPWPEGRPDGAQSGPAPVEVPSNLKSLLLLLVDTSAKNSKPGAWRTPRVWRYPLPPNPSHCPKATLKAIPPR